MAIKYTVYYTKDSIEKTYVHNFENAPTWEELEALKDSITYDVITNWVSEDVPA
tara:strand:- start:326 stop:487 length:162 start_codon:yes stop_codon:yes gene_type:complete